MVIFSAEPTPTISSSRTRIPAHHDVLTRGWFRRRLLTLTRTTLNLTLFVIAFVRLYLFFVLFILFFVALTACFAAARRATIVSIIKIDIIKN